MSLNEDFEDLEDLDAEPETITPQIRSKTPATKTPRSGSPGEKVNLFFKSTIGPGEKTEKLAVGKNTPVRDVKQTIGSLLGLNPDDFNLSHAGRIMDDDDIVGNYDVQDGDEVLLIPVSTAG